MYGNAPLSETSQLAQLLLVPERIREERYGTDSGYLAFGTDLWRPRVRVPNPVDRCSGPLCRLGLRLQPQS
jgi:hypothetical protein